MFHLMLGGRELFHSNFIAWLLGLDGDPFKLAALFGFKGVKLSVEREKLNLDLILSDGPLKKSVTRSSNRKIGRNGKKEFSEPQCVVVIENKFKSLPDEEQLAEYKVKIEGAYNKKNKKLILLSFEKPSWTMPQLPGNGDLIDFEWHWLSYTKLIEHLQKQLGNLKNNSDFGYLRYVEDYCKLVTETSNFVEAVKKEDKARVFWFRSKETKSQDEEAIELKLQDMLQKRRACMLQFEINKIVKIDRWLSVLITRDRHSEKPDPEEITFASEHGFTNKTPFVGAWLEVGAKHNELRLGVQIQGTQYRRYIMWKKFHVKEYEETKNQVRLKKFVDGTDRNQWLFGTDRDEKGIIVQNGFSDSKRGFKTSLNPKNPYCSYAPNFIYQYVNISEFDNHADLQPDNLPKSVIADLEYALKLLKKPDYRKRFESWKP